MKKVCVIGLGYLGLPTASILSSKGYKVIGVDVNQKLVEGLNKVNIDPIEPGLANLLNSAIRSGNYRERKTQDKRSLKYKSITPVRAWVSMDKYPRQLISRDFEN